MYFDDIKNMNLDDLLGVTDNRRLPPMGGGVIASSSFTPSRAGAIANPLTGMVSSADLEELRRKQAQAAWAAGAGSPRSMNTDDLLNAYDNARVPPMSSGPYQPPPGQPAPKVVFPALTGQAKVLNTDDLLNAYDNKRLAPMSGSSPAYSAPQASSPFPVQASVSDLVPSRASAIAGSTPNYGDFVGPIDTFVGPRPDDDGRAGPRMDASVNGILPAAGWSQGGWNGSQASPYAALDNFMSRDPVHTLGVNGFRTGSSNASVDYSGPMQRQQAIRNNMDIEAMLGRQDIARGANQLDAMRFMLASQDRQDAIRQRKMHDFNTVASKAPVGQREKYFTEAEAEGLYPPEVIAGMRHDDAFDAASRAGGSISKDTGRPNNEDLFLRELAKHYASGKLDKFEVINRLQGMGITANSVDKYRADPGLKPFVDAVIGGRRVVPNWFGELTGLHNKPWDDLLRPLDRPWDTIKGLFR